MEMESIFENVNSIIVDYPIIVVFLCLFLIAIIYVLIQASKDPPS